MNHKNYFRKNNINTAIGQERKLIMKIASSIKRMTSRTVSATTTNVFTNIPIAIEKPTLFCIRFSKV